MRTNPAIHQRRRVSLYGIKPRFVRALEPIRSWLEEWEIQPTTVTLLAIPVEIAAAASLVLGSVLHRFLILVPLLAVVWMGLNALDGSLARSTGRSTNVGAVLNELVDRLGDVVLVGAAFLIAPLAVSSVMAVGVLGAELVALIGWSVTGERNFPGPMGKPDRAATMSVGALAGIVWWPAVTVAFAVIGVASLIGAAVRMKSVIAAAGAMDRVGAS